MNSYKGKFLNGNNHFLKQPAMITNSHHYLFEALCFSRQKGYSNLVRKLDTRLALMYKVNRHVTPFKP